MFPSQFSAFAAQIADAQSRVFGASPGETSDHTPNLQLGAVQFRAAFASLRTQRDVELQGFRVQADAVAHIPLALGLTLDVDTELTHLATGDVYFVTQVVRAPASGSVKVALRRRSP